MERIVTYSFGDNFIFSLADFLRENFIPKMGNDLSRIACVFGGRRPSLFLKRELARGIKSSFIPPKTFSMDEFIDYIISQNNNRPQIEELDAYYTIYNLAKKYMPDILEGRESFSDFLSWAAEIVSFIEQLDLENIPDEILQNIQKSAAIGYEIPQSINHLLQNIIKLRGAYHNSLESRNIYSRAMRYVHAYEAAANNDFEEFDAVIFCNFFYLHAVEQKIIKNLYDKGKGICVFQGKDEEWPVLKNNAQIFSAEIKPKKDKPINYNLYLYEAFDTHSQVCMVREILKKNKDKKDTVVVVPRPETVIPLLSETACVLDEFNVSMGYPLKRSNLYDLFSALYRSQESRKEGKYYTKDFISVLRHSLVKNLKLGKDSAVTRVLVHKIEEILQGSEVTSVSGSLFLSLAEIENEEKIYLRASQTLENMGINSSVDECREVFKQINSLFFSCWEEVRCLGDFVLKLEVLLSVLAEKSMTAKFPFNIRVMEKLYEIKEALARLPFSKEDFPALEIWEIFQQRLEKGVVSFIGSPLRGTQILGLLETRSLNFENVIVMDMNESVFPKLKIYEPLIPREVMLILGLNRLEKEEEIQRYQFMRLISCAKEVHLIYEKNQAKEKSRFIEELLWNKQKQANKLEVISVPRVNFAIKVESQNPRVEKTPQMISSLEKEVYSASRINIYLGCPLQFYYRYVLGLKEQENLLEDPQSAHIGTFIHELLEYTFTKFKGTKPLIDAGFKKYFLNILESKFEKEIAHRMRSDSFLLKRIITVRMERFLEKEKERGAAKIICLEEKSFGTIVLKGKPVEFQYSVDRIDEFEDKSVVIIDYKTGGSDIAPNSFSTLENMSMSRESIKNNIKSFQLPLYYYLAGQIMPGVRLNAELYNLRTLERSSFISERDTANAANIIKICLEALEYIFGEIIDPSVPFYPDKEERKCALCEFVNLCK